MDFSLKLIHLNEGPGIGDYVSYLTPTTKNTRRDDWKSLNFAGTIDWAVDLQTFSEDDLNNIPDRPSSGKGCVAGEDDSVNTADLCEFACEFGFCPESLCTCIENGKLKPLPTEDGPSRVAAWDEMDVDVNRLCKFGCKYGYCPHTVCRVLPQADPEDGEDITEHYSYQDTKWRNNQKCIIFKNPDFSESTDAMCRDVCQDDIDQAKEEGRMYNYGCVGFFPLEDEIPWEKPVGVQQWMVPGRCVCDNPVLNDLADSFLEALAAAAQVSRFAHNSNRESFLLLTMFRLAAICSCQPSNSSSM